MGGRSQRRNRLPQNSGWWRVGINQRVSLRKFIDDIHRWVEEGRSDEWIASALGTSPERVELRLTPTRIVFLRRGAPGARWERSTRRRADDETNGCGRCR